MAVCLDNKIIFIHIYKTGGDSIRKALKEIGACREIEHKHCTIDEVIGSLQENQQKHATADQIKNDIFYNSCYKFTLVRNPFDWLVSLWAFILQRKHPLNEILPKDFTKFIHFWAENMQPGQKYQHNHQHHFINDDIHVFKLEEINKIYPSFLPKVTLTNTSKHKHYREHYTAETKAIVSRILKKDIQKFGYKF